MKRFSFGEEFSIRPADRLLEGVSISPLTSPLVSGQDLQAAIFRIEPGGAIRRHEATTHQMIAVLQGSCDVSGEDRVSERIREGEGVYIAKGEEHETRTVDGVTALIMEGESLRPFGLPVGDRD